MNPSPPPHARPAPVDHEVLDVIAGRWSSRAIDPRQPVERATLFRVLEAARWAPSWGNAQPWRYLVLDERVPGAREHARSCLNPGNAWARSAPVLLLVAVHTLWPGSRDPHPSAVYDTGAASMALCLQAHAEGLVVHQMGGFDHGRALELFPPDEGTEFLAMIALGHPGPLSRLDDRTRAKEERARTRRPIGDFAVLGGWDGPPVDVDPGPG